MHLLITGASTGIGEACARWMDRRGHDVFAGVRKPADAERLKAGSSARLRPVMLDVTDGTSIDAARREIEQHAGAAGLGGLVNNAGIAVAGPLEYLPLDSLRRQLEINVVGQIAVVQAFLPLVRRARGRIAFMGSIAGRMATPFLAPYSASKFALEAIADSLRLELRPFGVQVALIEPGSVATPIWKKSDSDTTENLSAAAAAIERDYGPALTAVRKAAADAERRGISADEVARVVEHALVSPSPRTRYLVGRDARIQAALAGLLPDRLRDRLLARALALPSPR